MKDTWLLSSGSYHVIARFSDEEEQLVHGPKRPPEVAPSDKATQHFGPKPGASEPATSEPATGPATCPVGLGLGPEKRT